MFRLIQSNSIETLAAALEHLAALDAKAEQPLRSSLVISQGASRLPRTGFFECVERLGRFAGPVDGMDSRGGKQVPATGKRKPGEKGDKVIEDAPVQSRRRAVVA